ncbi:hypothetical protein [Paenibacillus rigui]|uniref:Uncharacterized protein n=1 Tax=Paenibacillus rigui TaxID=554312 RepID=A0A229UQR4_9BACL|nr:hypothetical protein [Paenibacillus rigui]OXM85591.1 hypothetical protein CF651_14480 [Paenibacillus rigui]
MSHWKEALSTFCNLYFNSGKQIDWILVGSAGSALQGAGMSPNDIDIYTKKLEGVGEISELLKSFQLEEKSPFPYHDSNWLSSKEEPYFTQSFPSGFTWTKGRWKMHSFPLEVVHISDSAGIPDSEDGEGIWEGGKYIWDKKQYVDFQSFDIPLVPLEIQLESNLRRQRQDRIQEIINVLKARGYNEKLLRTAVSSSNHEYLKGLL